MSNNPKKHHYIPKFILDNFTDKNGYIHFSKTGISKSVEKSKPQNFFIQNHLYSSINESNEKDTSFEIELSKIESEVSPVIRKIITSTRKKNLPNLYEDEKNKWDYFFYYQIKRVPEFYSKIVDNFEKYLDYAIDTFEQTERPLEEYEKELIQDEEVKKRLKKNSTIVALGRNEKKVLDILNKRGLAILYIQKQNQSFIMGSNPAIRIPNHGKTRLDDDGVELWLPISFDIAISPSFTNPPEILQIAEMEEIRHINELSFKQSSIIAGKSPKLIQSLVNYFKNQEKKISNHK
ncbi:MAG: DUF4238 domain-containing protein [Candidatus Hinthialibacter antarcticus]|nr:DUF4238 domain-containing protein [Candidatus Hinthialibacter antarcticus]